MSNQPTENKALATIDHKHFLEKRQADLSKWIVGGLRPEALIRFALHDLSTNEKLRACTPQSIYLGLLACAVTGLEPGSLKGEAYLVPFGGKAQFMVGWKGIVKQARRSAIVKTITANIVCERDIFDIDLGTANRIIHKPALTARGETIGAYAWAQLADGSLEIEWLDMEDLSAIRKVAESRGKSPAWSDWPDQMQRKSALRRLGKRLPLGEDYYRGIAIDHATDEGSSMREQLDVITDGDASATGGSEGTPVSQFVAPPQTIAPQGPPPGMPATEPAKTRGRPPKPPVEVAATERPTPPPPSSGGASASVPAASSPAMTTSDGSAMPSTGSGPVGRSDLGEPAGGSATKFNAAVETARAADVARAGAALDVWGQPVAVDPTPEEAREISRGAHGRSASNTEPSPSTVSAPASSEASGADTEGFGEDPEDKPAAPAANRLADFFAELVKCMNQREVVACGNKWRPWSEEQAQKGDLSFRRGGENAAAMAKAYAKRKTEVPA